MDNTSIVIGGNTIESGTKKTILFPAPNLNTQIKMDIPVHVFHGKKKGPKLFICSSIHGDELNGIEIIRRIHEHIKIKRLHGTIITIPVVNIYGIMMQTRYLPDRRDLNRSFPGSKKGTLAGRLAHGLIKQVVSHCDYGIDLHTGAYGRINMPQLRVDFSARNVKAFAKSFRSPVILDSKQRSGSLRQAAQKIGIPLIVYEGGEALRHNEICIRAGVRGILNVLHYLKMIKVKEKHNGKHSKTFISNTSRWIRSPASGLVVPSGDVLSRAVKKGEILAHIEDPLLMNPHARVIAPFKGIVIGQALKSIATQGDALYHIASFKKLSGVRAYIDTLHDEITNQ